MTMRTRVGGLTLVELLVVLSIVAILAAAGAPSFGTFLRSTRVSSTVLQLASDLNLARSEAIKRNSRVLICVKDSAGTGCGTGTNWQAGWLVCSAQGSDSACDAATTTRPNPIAVRSAVASDVTITASAAKLSFNANGSQSSNGAAATLVIASAGVNTKTISIAATGNVSSQ